MSFRFSGNLKVTEELRKELSRPYGVVLNKDDIARRIRKNQTIYAVGDVTVAALLELGYLPKVSIFDYRTERKTYVPPIIKKVYKNPLKVRNRKGVLSQSLWKVVKRSAEMKSAVGIRVYGEEDLALRLEQLPPVSRMGCDMHGKRNWPILPKENKATFYDVQLLPLGIILDSNYKLIENWIDYLTFDDFQ